MYHVFGLNIRSAIPLPALRLSDPSPEVVPDVVIEYGDTPIQLANPRRKGVRFQAAPGEFLLRVDSVARYYVKEGRHIVITPEPGVAEEEILVFLLGSSIAALLQQRNILVLHAGAIMVNGKCAVFAGPSGVGKSTLTAGFHQRCYPFLADDVCAITLVNGKPFVIPGFLRLKLWADCLRKLNADKDTLRSVLWDKGLEKYFLPVERFLDSPVPLKSLFVLETTETDTIEIIAVKGSEKIILLINNSKRLGYVDGYGRKHDHIMQCAAVAANVDVYRTVRPGRGFSLTELMDLLEARF
jgi:hypothetical protein